MPNRAASNAEATYRLSGVTGKGFLPGQSGNPEGRRREQSTVRDLARSRTPEAIETLATAMRSAPWWHDRIEAARIILEAGWGKPAQAVLTAQTEASSVTWERLLEMVMGEGTEAAEEPTEP